jgi:hypothetical protein
MALGVTQDNSVLAILKEYYGVQDVEALVFRNSPALGMIKKERVGGKYIPVPMAVYGSGAVTSDYNQVTQQAANTYSGIAMQVTPGRLFSSFVLDPEEFLASQGDRAAFVSVFALKAMLAMDDLRKVLATCLYRSGYLELGTILAVDATSKLYIDVDASTAMAVSPGTQIMFAPTPSGTYRNANAVIVSKIETFASTGNTRITFVSAYDATVAVGDFIMIKGGRDAGAQPSAPVGLSGWLPTNGNRSGGTWTTYIATAFFGVNRSTAPDRLAGQYVLRDAVSNETYTSTLLRLLKACRRGGSIADIIIMNDDDFGILLNEATANRTFMQQIQGSGASGKNQVTQGVDQFQMSFSTSWINTVIDDPYCPKNFAYILDSEAVRLFTITSADKVLTELPINNAPGQIPKASSASEPTKNFGFLWDDMYTTTPVALQSGMGIRVDFNFFGTFALTRPASCGVAQFK